MNWDRSEQNICWIVHYRRPIVDSTIDSIIQ